MTEDYLVIRESLINRLMNNNNSLQISNILDEFYNKVKNKKISDIPTVIDNLHNKLLFVGEQYTPYDICRYYMKNKDIIRKNINKLLEFDEYDKTFIHRIIDYKNFPLLKTMKKEITESNILDKEGNNLLLYVCNSLFYLNKNKFMEFLIKSCKIDINAQNKYGETALIKSAINADKVAIKILLDNNADFTIINHYDSYSCLNYLRTNNIKEFIDIIELKYFEVFNIIDHVVFDVHDLCQVILLYI
jgi:hypothetical protein